MIFLIRAKSLAMYRQKKHCISIHRCSDSPFGKAISFHQKPNAEHRFRTSHVDVYAVFFRPSSRASDYRFLFAVYFR